MGKAKQSNNKKKNSELFIRRIDNHNKFALNFFWKYGKEFFEAIEYSQSDQKDNDSNDIVQFRVAFVGFGEYAYEFLKVLCCLGQLPRCRLIIYIFDKYAEERKAKIQPELLAHCANCANRSYTEKVFSLEEFNAGNEAKKSEELTSLRYHDSPFYEIHFVECDVEKNEFSDSIKGTAERYFTHMFFMLGSDAANINVATKARIAYHRNINMPAERKPAQFYVMVKNDDTTTQLMTFDRKGKRSGKGGEYVFADDVCRIKLIGSNSEMYSFDTIEERELERLGMQVHKLYAFKKILTEKLTEYNKKEKKRDSPLEKKIITAVIGVIKKVLNSSMSAEIVNKILENKDVISKNTDLQMLLTDDGIEHFCEEINAPYKEVFSEIRLSKDQYYAKFREAIKPLIDKLENLYSPEWLEKAYNEREYYRRSSKSRVLFEKMLYKLGYLYDDDGEIKPNNVVPEFKVTDKAWESPEYTPVNMSDFKVYNQDGESVSGSGEDYISTGQHINGQWFEVNNILQKRWMVFRWGEGYENTNSEEEIDFKSKTHKFLKPYKEIYANNLEYVRQTLGVIFHDDKGKKS